MRNLILSRFVSHQTIKQFMHLFSQEQAVSELTWVEFTIAVFGLVWVMVEISRRSGLVLLEFAGIVSRWVEVLGDF